MIFEIVIVFDPEFPIRVHNKLHQPPSRIAYMDLGIVPLATSAFFFLLTHCFPELITTFVMGSGGDLSGLPFFYAIRAWLSICFRTSILVSYRFGAGGVARLHPYYIGDATCNPPPTRL